MSLLFLVVGICPSTHLLFVFLSFVYSLYTLGLAPFLSIYYSTYLSNNNNNNKLGMINIYAPT